MTPERRSSLTRGQFGYENNPEPYASPGDYNVQHIVGNSQIALSYIKTPPHFSFQRESRNLEPLSKSHVFSEAGGQKSKTFISPGVGDY